MNVASILRHWFTLAATLLTAWVISLVVMPPDKQAVVTQAITDLVEPVVIIGTLVITALWRMALAWISDLRGKSENDDEGNDERGGGSGGITLLLVTGAAVGILGSLPSCSSIPPPGAITVTYQLAK